MRRKRWTVLAVFAMVVALLPLNAVPAAAAPTTDLIITGVVDGPLNGGVPKAVELYALNDITDLSVYGLGSANNGGGSDGEEFTFPADSVSAGTFIYVASESDGFDIFFGFAPGYTSSAAAINGDDAIELFMSGSVVDVFGDINTDGTGQPWEYKDGWAYRVDATGPDGSAFVLANWTFSGPDALDGETSNAAAATPFPIGTYLAGAPSGPADPVINEFVFNHTGTDSNEYVEISGDADTDYSAYTIVEIEGDDSGAGLVDDGTMTVGTTNSDGIWVSGFQSNLWENGTVSLLLVEGFTGAVGDDLDTDDDGVLDSEPWSRVVDAVGVNDGDSGDRNYSNVVLEKGYDGLNFYTVGGASRIPNGTDTDTASDWVRNDFDGYGLPGFTGTPELGEAENTPGTINAAVTQEQADFGVCGADFTPIYKIQGSGDSTPLFGQQVVTEGVVVGDFQEGNELKGFHLQDPIGDGDPATSDGIFVYYGYWNGQVNAGDHVRVMGTATEYHGLTEISPVAILEVCATGETVEPTELTLPVAGVDDFEAYEGMLVTFPQDLYITEFYNFDRYGEIVLATERQYQPTSLFEPGSADAYALRDAIPLHRITLDDGRSDQNPDPARHPNGAPFTLDNRFRGGDIVTNVTGVMDYAFGKYKIQPTAGADYTEANPRPLSPPDVGGTVKVASFNVLNFFTHIDNGTNKCGPKLDTHQCRGADTSEELQRQLDKIVAGIIGTGADIVGLQEIENDIVGVDSDGNRAHDPVLTLVEALNAAEGDGTWAWVGEADHYNEYPVRNEIIYKPATVTPVGDPVAYDDEAFDKEKDGYPVGRPPLAQTFVEKATGEAFTVVTNHFKSKGSSCSVFGDPYDSFQANCNLTRVAQSKALLDFVDDLQAVDPDVLIIGDLNSYAKEDPIDVLIDGGFTDLHQAFEGPSAYSYVFDGQLGYLDHALANSSLLANVTGAAAWHINADEPDILNYDMTYKKDAQDALYEPNAFRASDHDPVIVGLQFDFTPPELDVSVDPEMLWPPNHKYWDVEALTEASDNSLVPVTVQLISVVSSEADCCLGDDDLPNDIVIVDDHTFQLRAERFSKDGRVYTVTYRATDFAGNWTEASATVIVPHSMGKKTSKPKMK